MRENNAGRPACRTPLSILVVSIRRELAEMLMQAVCVGACGDMVELKLEGQPLVLRVFDADSRLSLDWTSMVAGCRAVALVARFVDVASLDEIKALYRRLPDPAQTPLSVFLLREEGEQDFKMSCPACGQKLWVRDVDVGKGGRCPSCKKGFGLPSQAAHVRAQLALPESVPCETVVRGRPNVCAEALADLVSRIPGSLVSGRQARGASALEQRTVSVQVTTGGAS